LNAEQVAGDFFDMAACMAGCLAEEEGPDIIMDWITLPGIPFPGIGGRGQIPIEPILNPGPSFPWDRPCALLPPSPLKAACQAACAGGNLAFGPLGDKCQDRCNQTLACQ